MKKATAELKTMVLARGSNLMDLYGVGPFVAARVLADAGDVARFADRNRFASADRPAPPHSTRPRVSRTGTGSPAPGTAGSTTSSTSPPSPSCATTPVSTRQAAPTTGASDPRARSPSKPCAASSAGSPTRSTASSSSTPPRARTLARTPPRHGRAAREGTAGRLNISSAAGSHPHTGTSDQPQPGPAPTTLPAAAAHRQPSPGSAPQPPRRRGGAVNVERPTGRTTLTATSAGAHSTEPNPES